MTLGQQFALSDAVTRAVLEAARPAYEDGGGMDPDFWRALRHGLDDARALLLADAGLEREAGPQSREGGR